MGLELETVPGVWLTIGGTVSNKGEEMPRNLYTATDDARIKAMYAEGSTDKEIGAAIGRTGGSVQQRRGFLGVVRPRSTWSDDQVAYLCENAGNMLVKHMAAHIGKTFSATQAKMTVLGLTGFKRVFTEDEDKIIKKAYEVDYLPLPEIGQLVDRDLGTLRQHIMKLGLHRDARRMMLINRFGDVGRDMNKTVEEIRSELNDNERAVRIAQRDADKAKVAAAISDIKVALSQGVERRAAYQAALIAGATLNDIGIAQGVTRERVRQVVYNVTAPYVPVDQRPGYTGVRAKRKSRVVAEKACERCWEPFTGKWGNEKYCGVCRPAALADNIQRARDANNRAVLMGRLVQRLMKLDRAGREVVINQVLEESERERQNSTGLSSGVDQRDRSHEEISTADESLGGAQQQADSSPPDSQDTD